MSSKSLKNRYSVNDQVLVDKNREGIIRFKGELDGKHGIFYGIELTVGKGKHNGTHDQKQYFQCKHGKGVFVTAKQIICKINTNMNTQSSDFDQNSNLYISKNAEKLKEEREANSKELFEMKQKINKLSLEYKKQIEESSADLEAKIKSLTRDNQVLKRKLEKLECVSGKKQKKMENEREMRLKANKERFSLKQKLERLQKAIAARLKILGVDFSKVDDITSALDMAFNVIQKLVKELQKKEEDFEDLKTKSSKAIKETGDLYKEQIDKLNKNNKNNITQLSELHTQQMKGKEIEFSSQINNLKHKIEEMQLLNDENENKLNELKRQNVESEKGFNTKIAILSEQINILTHGKSEINNQLKIEKEKYKQLKENEESNKDKLEKELNDMKQQNEILNEKLKQNEMNLNENECSFKKQETELKYSHEKAMEAMKYKNEKQKQEIVKLKDEINQKDGEYNSKFEKQEIELLELKDEINKLQNDRTNTANEQINELILNNKKDMEKLNCEIIFLKEQNRKLQENEQKLTDEQLNKNVGIEQQTQQKQAFEMQINNLGNKIKELESLNKKQCNKNKTDIEALKKRIGELIQLLNKKVKQLSDERKKEKQLRQQLATQETIFKIQLKELGQFTKKIKRREQVREKQSVEGYHNLLKETELKNENQNKDTKINSDDFDVYLKEMKHKLKEISVNDNDISINTDENDKILQYLCSLSNLNLSDDENEQKILDEIESDQKIVKEIEKFSNDIHPIMEHKESNEKSNEIMYGQVIHFSKNKQKKGWIYNDENDWMYPFNVANIEYRIGDVVCFSIYKRNGRDWANDVLISEKYDESVWGVIYDKQNNKCKCDNGCKLLIKDALINLNANLCIEFKQIKPVNGSCDLNEICEVMLKYLNVFANTKGGTIYFGIDSNGIINGQKYINNNTMENIQKYINKYLILKKEITIEFIKVIHRKPNNYCYLVSNVYVIKASINGIIERVKSSSDYIIEIKQQLKEMTGNDIDESIINDVWNAQNKNKQMTLQYLCHLYLNDDSKEHKEETKCNDKEQLQIWLCPKCATSNQLTFQFCTECGHAFAKKYH